MRALLLAMLILVACGTSAPVLLPETVGAWKRVSMEEQPERVRVYRYEGQSAVTVTTYEFPSGTVAFERFQKWHVEPGTFPFYKGRLLVVPRGADAGQLRAFSETLQPLLP